MPFPQVPVKWIPLWSSLGFLLRSPKLLGISFLLAILLFGLTWGGYLLAVSVIDAQTAGFFQHPPVSAGIWGWIKLGGWQVLKWSFFLLSRIVSFYLAFLLAYSLSAPGYVFLSGATEKRYAQQDFEEDAPFNFQGIMVDMLEGLKIGALGLLVTMLALTANFIPLVGQILVLFLYTFYLALSFLDYPASRRRWSLGRKINWLRNNSTAAIHIGILPAIISLIPLFNIFLMALIFPLFTVHTTLNFSIIMQQEKQGATASEQL
jgi:CysZ protein